jgi:hypothetical protein
MKGSGELHTILQVPAPRPLKPIYGGPAFRKSVVYLSAAALSIVAGLINLWHYLFMHYREPLLGNERLVISYVVFFLSVGGFIFFWSISFMNLYSVYLYRSGSLSAARVEKSYIQEKKGRRYYVINWMIEEGGRVSKGAVSVPIGDLAAFDQDIAKGDTILLLSSGRDLVDAMPAGMMGLRKDLSLLPSLSPPPGLDALRWGATFTMLACACVAVVGMMSSWLLDDEVPRKVVLVSAAVGAVLAILFWLASRRLAALLRPSRVLWIGAVFAAGFFACFGAAKGLNVWLDSRPPATHRAEILYLDDTFFPTLHRFAFVRSWRTGRIKEKIPIFPRTGYGLAPGETMEIDVRTGAFGMPAVTAIRP